MPDRDLLEIFDAALPRIEQFFGGSVPQAGSKELAAYTYRRSDQRARLGLFGLMTAAFGFLAWLAWAPWMPIAFFAVMIALTGAGGVATAHAFLQLAFGQRLEMALPAGTDGTTARLEKASWSSISEWNTDVFVWNRRVEALREEVADWQSLRDDPGKRGVEWTEAGSRIRAEGLLAAIDGLAADRSALLARKSEIDHALRSLDARLCQLKAGEEKPVHALPPAPEDPDDD